MVSIIVDDRERAVVGGLTPLCLDVIIRRIHVGDFALVRDGQVLLVIERKTLSDLAASIKDGRMENHDRLIALRATTGAQILYIIEGSPHTNLRSKFGGIPFGALRAKLDSLMFGSGALVIWTKSPAATAERLVSLRDRFEKMSVAPGGPPMEGTLLDAPVGGAVPAPLLEQKEHTPDSTHIAMLTCVKGVSAPTARLMLTRYRLRDYITGEFEPQAVYDLKYEGGSIIGQRAIPICEQLIALGEETKLKMAACVHGISLATAALVLAAVPFERLVAWDCDVDQIADIKKPNGRRIGSAVARRLFEVFVHVPPQS
jgi:ERCC4-type nuclease